MALALEMFCMLTSELFSSRHLFFFSGVLNQGQRLLFAHGAIFFTRDGVVKISQAIQDCEPTDKRGLYLSGRLGESMDRNISMPRAIVDWKGFTFFCNGTTAHERPLRVVQMQDTSKS